MAEYKPEELAKMYRMKAKIDYFYAGEITWYTPSDVCEIVSVYNEIIREGSGETTITCVKLLYENYGFTIEEKGLGWIISLKTD